jgi:hypothetical protein
MTSFSVDLAALEDAAAGINSTINELRSHSMNQLEVTVAQSGHRDAKTFNEASQRSPDQGHSRADAGAKC